MLSRFVGNIAFHTYCVKANSPNIDVDVLIIRCFLNALIYFAIILLTQEYCAFLFLKVLLKKFSYSGCGARVVEFDSTFLAP